MSGRMSQLGGTETLILDYGCPGDIFANPCHYLLH